MGARIWAGGGVLAVALVGCGSGRQLPANDVTRGLSPAVAVRQAVARINGRPLVVHLDISVAYSSSGAPDAIKNRLANASAHGTEDIRVANQNQAVATLNLTTPGGSLHNGELIVDNGTAYFCAIANAGLPCSRVAGPLAQTFTAITSLSRQLAGKNFAGLRYIGYERDGKRYSGTLSSTAATAINGLAQSQSGTSASVGSSHIDLWIDPISGDLTREVSSVPTSIALSEIRADTPGTLIITTTVDARVHISATPITVRPPTSVSGTVSSFGDLLQH